MIRLFTTTKEKKGGIAREKKEGHGPESREWPRGPGGAEAKRNAGWWLRNQERGKGAREKGWRKRPREGRALRTHGEWKWAAAQIAATKKREGERHGKGGGQCSLVLFDD